MEPLPLPPPSKMAAAVSNVTQTMVGLTFMPDQEKRSAQFTWRTAVLPISGSRPLTIGLSSDERGCRMLSAALFSCPEASVDESMMEDALRELVNMTAGILKNTMSINEQALGLPRILRDSGAAPAANPHGIVLKADSLGLVLWICEGVS